MPGSARTVGKGTSEAILQAKQNQGFGVWVDTQQTYTGRNVRTIAWVRNSRRPSSSDFNLKGTLRTVDLQQNEL